MLIVDRPPPARVLPEAILFVILILASALIRLICLVKEFPISSFLCRILSSLITICNRALLH